MIGIWFMLLLSPRLACPSVTGHPSLKAEKASLGIIDRCCSDFQRPTEREGFGRVVVLREGDSLWNPDLMQLTG